MRQATCHYATRLLTCIYTQLGELTLTEGIVKVGERLAYLFDDYFKLGRQDCSQPSILFGTHYHVTCVATTRVQNALHKRLDHRHLYISQSVPNNNFVFMSLAQVISTLFSAQLPPLQRSYPIHFSTSRLVRGKHD